MFSIYNNYIKEQDELIEKLENEIVELNQKNQILMNENEKLKEVSTKEEIQYDQDILNTVKKDLEKEIEEKQKLEKIINGLEDKIDNLNNRLEEEKTEKKDENEVNKIIEENHEKISQLEQDKYELQSSLTRMEEQVRERDKEISTLMEKIKGNEDEIPTEDEYEKQTKNLEDRLNDKNQIINKLEEDIKELKDKLEEKSIETMIDEQSIVKDEETIIHYEERIRKLEEVIDEYKEKFKSKKSTTQEKTDLINYLESHNLDVNDILDGNISNKSVKANIGYINLSNYYDIQNEEGLEKSSELVKFWNNKLLKYIDTIGAYPLTNFSNTVLFIQLNNNGNHIKVDFSALIMNMQKDINDYSSKHGMDIITPQTMGCIHTGDINILRTENPTNPLMITGENLIIPSAVMPVMKEKGVQFALTFSTEVESIEGLETDYVTDIKLKGRKQRIKLYELISVDNSILERLRQHNKNNLTDVEIKTEDAYENVDDSIEDDLGNFDLSNSEGDEEIDFQEIDNESELMTETKEEDIKEESNFEEDIDISEMDIEDEDIFDETDIEENKGNESSDYADKELEDFDLEEDNEQDDFDFHELDDVLIEDEDLLDEEDK